VRSSIAVAFGQARYVAGAVLLLLASLQGFLVSVSTFHALATTRSSFLRFPLGRGSFFLAGAGAFPPVVVATAAAMASASTVRENLFENEENLGTARAEQMRTRK
jgi:hypothetical protein